MLNGNVKSRLVMAAAAAAMVLSASSAWAIGGVIGGTYQDQVNLTSNKKDVLLSFKTNTAVVVVDTVTCQIQTSTPPPYEISLSQLNANGVLVFIPLVFSGQTSSKNVFTAFANNLNYGISGGGKAEVLVRFAAAGNYNVICSIVGKRN